jgi:hypothetical protein
MRASREDAMVGRRIPGRLEPRTARAGEDGAHTTTRRPNRTRKGRPPAISEYVLHKTIAELLNWVLVPPAFATTFPAGWGKMTPAMSGMLQACGLKRGMPDMLVFPGGGRMFGLEFKSRIGTVSQVQREMFDRLYQLGFSVYLVRSPDDVMDVLRRQSVPLRAKTTMNAGLYPCASSSVSSP